MSPPEVSAPTRSRPSPKPGRPPRRRDGWFELFVNHPEGAGFPFLHRDTCHVHAVSMQIQGRKFVMFPPEDARYLYPLGGSGPG